MSGSPEPGPTTGAGPTTASTPADLDTCASESIHIPGSIQPHGVLLALREPELTVVQASANCADALGAGPEQILGRALDDLIGAAGTAHLRDVLATSYDLREASPLELTLGVGGREVAFDVVPHRVDGLVVLELLATSERRPLTFAGTYQRTRTSVLRLNRASSLSELYEVAAEEVRRLTGFDRVMVHRFDAEWNGEVVAEARREDLNSFLGLHYPATDIPAQARALYERSWPRLIPDVGYRAEPVVPPVNPVSGRPLDMSDAWLRSVSPVHLEYLTNMGVTASMSVSLLRDGRSPKATGTMGGAPGRGGHPDGRLWGLLVCHHYAGPREPSYELCAAAEFLGQILSLLLVSREEGQILERLVRARSTLGRLVEAISREDAGLASVLFDGTPNLLDLVEAGGVAAQVNGDYRTAGMVPPYEVVSAMFRALDPGDGLVALNSVPLADDRFAAYKDVACGVLGVRLSPDEAVVWFRPETPRVVDWGGDPRNKEIAAREGPGVRRSPRKSFERWRETVRLRARPWTPTEIDLASDLRRELVRVMYGRSREAGRLAETVQQSLLPDQLPDVPGYDVGARYSPAPGGKVGGDWYDAFALPGGEVAVVVGDVAGHGLAAAGVMGQLRNALRAYLVDGDPVTADPGPGPDPGPEPGADAGAAGDAAGDAKAVSPGRALARLDRLTSLLMPDALATAVVVVLDPASGAARVASAGHPPPLTMRVGRSDLLELTAAPPLGAWSFGPPPDLAALETSVRLGPGDALVLYSDGLVERRGEAPDTGLARLRTLATAHRAGSGAGSNSGSGADSGRGLATGPGPVGLVAASWADALFDGCHDPDNTDDTTILVVRRRPA